MLSCLLVELPSEVVLMILRCLDPLSLSKASRTCQRLHELTEPILYSNVHLSRRQGPVFVRSIQERPSLAQHVRRIAFGYHNGLAEIDAAKILPFVTGLRELTIPSNWGPGHRNWNIWASDVEKTGRGGFCAHIFKHALDPRSGILKNLQSCTLQYYPIGTWGAGAGCFALDPCILLQPALRVLNIRPLFQCQLRLSPSCLSQSGARTANLTTLVLRKCSIDPTTLHKILSIPRALGHLELTGLLEGDTYSVEIAAYVEAVAQHRHSLEHLLLHKHNATRPRQQFGAGLGLFESLKSLDVQCSTIFPDLTSEENSLLSRLPDVRDFLPRSLENLTLSSDRGCSEDPWNILRRLADEKRGQLSRLRRIILRKRWHWRWIVEREMSRSKIADSVSVLNAVGVEVVDEVVDGPLF